MGLIVKSKLKLLNLRRRSIVDNLKIPANGVYDNSESTICLLKNWAAFRETWKRPDKIHYSMSMVFKADSPKLMTSRFVGNVIEITKSLFFLRQFGISGHVTSVHVTLYHPFIGIHIANYLYFRLLGY